MDIYFILRIVIQHYVIYFAVQLFQLYYPLGDLSVSSCVPLTYLLGVCGVCVYVYVCVCVCVLNTSLHSGYKNLP